MTLDVELYRRTVYLPPTVGARFIAPAHPGDDLGAVHPGDDQAPLARALPRRISVIDIHPEGATQTLVFIHGYGGNALQWLYQLRFFGQTMAGALRVVAPDLRGHGLSDDPELPHYSMDGLVNDLEMVLDVLHVQRPFSLIAHSFGGAIATEYTLRHAEDVHHLVLIGVPTRFIIRPLVQRLLNVPDPIFSRIAKLIGVALYAPQHTLKRMNQRVMSVWRGDERLQQLHVPTLVIMGQRDTVFLRQHYEDVHRSIPNAQHVVIPVSAHLVQLERPDAVNRAIRRIIEPKIELKNVGAASSMVGVAHAGDGKAPLAGARAARLTEMPWLQHYDRDVPQQIPLPRQPLHEMLSNAARSYPDRPALVFFGQQIPYRELDRLTNRFARALLSLGIKKGDRVAIILPNIPQFVIAFYGTLKAGAVVVLGSPLSNEEEITYQLRDSETQLLLTLTSYRAMLERVCSGTNVKQIIYTDVREYLPIRQRVLIASLVEGSEPHAVKGRLNHSPNAASPASPLSSSLRQVSLQHLMRGQSAAPFDSGTTSDDLALLLYTSGTTDTPKGVMLSHGNSMVNVTQVRHWIVDARRGKEVILCVLPLSHSYGVNSCMNMSIAIAASLVLLPTTRTDQVLEAIKKERPSIFPGIPALYLAIANYPKVRSYGVSAIRSCISGSAPLPVEVQEAFEKLTRGRLVEGYGLTEASPVTHSNPLQGERRVGSIGIPLPSTHARIVDLKTDETLPPGEVGELLIRGPQVMQGYWHMPGETAQVLRDGWLHTGDLARMDDDGFFTIVDRKKDLILAGAYNIYPRDVEEVLYEHPKVLEAAVVSAMPREKGATSPFIKAVVVLKRGEKATADELIALCRERLDSYKVPAQIEFRTELPKNIVGKVLRRMLLEA